LKKLIAVCLTAVLLIPAASAGMFGPPELSAECAILMDGESGRVICEKNARQERSIASITKLMTALVAVEGGLPLDSEVQIKPEWSGIEGSSIYLKPDECVTLEMLLYGMLLQSGNDAAAAVAGYCAGSVESFVTCMNEKAETLGMKQTHFTNPSGLSDEGHYSTAYDMALLGRACLQNETVAKIMGTKTVTVGGRTFTNHNKLLWRYEGCTGMKTGFTEKAGRTLVSSAERNGQTLVAVTLNAPNDWNDHQILFDYGFSLISRQILCTAGKRVRRVPVRGGLVPFVCVVTAQDLYYPLAGTEQVRARFTLDPMVDAPVEKGAELGKLSYYLNETLIAETALLAGESVNRNIVQPGSALQRIREILAQ